MAYSNYITHQGRLWRLGASQFNQLKRRIRLKLPVNLDNYGQYLGPIHHLETLFATVEAEESVAKANESGPAAS